MQIATALQPRRPVGAIHLRGEESVDTLLDQLFRRYTASGFKVHGYLQSEVPEPESFSPAMFLSSPGGENRFRISQSLGRGSSSCRVDSGAIAEVAARLLGELDADVDLLILNRFGRCESQGGGLRSVIEFAFLKKIPLLIAVREKYLEEWNEFIGDFSDPLACEYEGACDWCDQILRQR